MRGLYGQWSHDQREVASIDPTPTRCPTILKDTSSILLFWPSTGPPSANPGYICRYICEEPCATTTDALFTASRLSPQSIRHQSPPGHPPSSMLPACIQHGLPARSPASRAARSPPHVSFITSAIPMNGGAYQQQLRAVVMNFPTDVSLPTRLDMIGGTMGAHPTCDTIPSHASA